MRHYRFDEAVGRRVSLHGSRFTEEHETGTATGLTAVVLEGDDLWVGAVIGGPSG